MRCLTLSRFLRHDRVHKLAPGTFAKAPTGDVFVKPALKKGILPEILEELLGARKRCRPEARLATSARRQTIDQHASLLSSAHAP